jgi:hypothetical protein
LSGQAGAAGSAVSALLERMSMERDRDAAPLDRCYFCSRPFGGNEPAQLFMGLRVHARCYHAEVDGPSGGRARAAGGAADPSYLFVPVRPSKNPFAVELGRRGGLKGGRARAQRLSPSRRREIARLAARARWGAGRPGSSA